MPRGRKRTLDDTKAEMEAEGAFPNDLNAMRKADKAEDEKDVILDRWQERKRKRRLRRDQPHLDRLREKGIINKDHLKE